MFDKIAFYDLGVDNTALTIHMSPQTWEYCLNMLPNYKFIPTMEELTSRTWLAPESTLPNKFGFGENNLFETIQKPDTGWVICKGQFPTNNDSDLTFACILKCLFAVLWLFGSQVASDPDQDNQANNQLVIIEDIIFKSRSIQGDYGLSASILSPTAKWIVNYMNRKLSLEDTTTNRRIIHPEITETMQCIAQHSNPERFTRHPSGLRECHCEFSDYSGVFFNSYGDRCDLGKGGAHNWSQAPRPYTIGPHNCDNFGQQFVLLAGVAKLCEVARREITKS
ncbi:hypothetical protein KJ836_02380 [Patescibacteria group bacterium]|nr:hypothetical protein [Patescibacteria group bacterium]